MSPLWEFSAISYFSLLLYNSLELKRFPLCSYLYLEVIREIYNEFYLYHRKEKP